MDELITELYLIVRKNNLTWMQVKDVLERLEDKIINQKLDDIIKNFKEKNIYE